MDPSNETSRAENSKAIDESLDRINDIFDIVRQIHKRNQEFVEAKLQRETPKPIMAQKAISVINNAEHALKMRT